MTNIVILSSLLVTNWEGIYRVGHDSNKPPTIIYFKDGTKATNYININTRKGEVWKLTTLGVSVDGKVEPLGDLVTRRGTLFETNGLITFEPAALEKEKK